MVAVFGYNTRSSRVSIAISTWTQQVACIPPVEDAMPEISDSAVVQQKLGSLPLVTYQAGDTVLTAGSRSGQLLILKSGAVAIIKEDIEIAKVREPGAVLGELSALLDQPHTADVRALETSQFHIAEASSLLGREPVVLLHVAAILARRLDSANQVLIELKSQLDAGEARSAIDKTVDKIDLIISAGGASLVHAG